MSRRWLALVSLALLSPHVALGATAQYSSPSLDRWMYPFNGTPGERPSASVFGNTTDGGSPSFDQRDAQFLLGFATAGGPSGIAAGQGAGNYIIHSARLELTVVGGTFAYDPSYDAFVTLLPAGDSRFIADGDLGRPVELHGVGFRNGYTQLSLAANDNLPPGFDEATSFGTPGPPARRVRHAFAAGANGGGGPLVDISNNIQDGFDPAPFAVGATGLAPGADVPTGAVLIFSLDVGLPAVQSYLAEGLNAGLLGFTVTSFHPAAQGGPATYPIFATRENAQPGFAPRLTVDYSVAPVPEPTGWLLSLMIVVAICLAGHARRRREFRRPGRAV